MKLKFVSALLFMDISLSVGNVSLSNPSIFAFIRHLRGRHTASSILCRMTIIDTLYEDSLRIKTQLEKEDTVCIPILEGIEQDDLFSVALPTVISSQYKSEMHSGSLFVRISNATLAKRSIVIGDLAEFNVVPTPAEHLRRLQEVAEGTMTFAVVRVSTVDAAPKDSADTLRDALFGDGINFKTQFNACSFSQLRWEPASVYDVNLDISILDFGESALDLITAAQTHMTGTMNITAVSSLADKVIFCLPSGTGSWAASSAILHWRMQLNDDWCLSLSASMHEAGHLLGLYHAGDEFFEYGDMTGYMGASYRNDDWPRKCYNGVNSWKLGWYNYRMLQVNPIQDGP